MHKQQAFPQCNTAAAIIVAAGKGERMGGGLAKQYRPLGGKPVLRWSVDAFLRCDRIGAVVVVVGPEDSDRAAAILPASPRVRLAIGGATRTESVRNGLGALLAAPPDAVLIHDAARPGLSLSVIEDLLAALAGAHASCPALPMTDAVKETGASLRSVDRERLVRVQTPQAFRYGVIADALARADGSAVDDLALVESLGAHVQLTAGRPELMKLTHPEDFGVLERLLGVNTMRVGSGFDVHAFAPGDGVTVCGVRIPHTKSLEGHSDADVGWHAITDAILGAAALGDIGEHFSNTDPRWKGADSLVFLQHAAKLAADKGLRVVNVDLTLICERPKMSPHKAAMRARTAEALGLDIDCISVKATTTEKLGFTGREEGIAAQAVVMMAPHL